MGLATAHPVTASFQTHIIFVHRHTPTSVNAKPTERLKNINRLRNTYHNGL